MFKDSYQVPAALHYVRGALIAPAIVGRAQAPEFAAARWGADSGAFAVAKANVAGAGEVTGEWGEDLGDIEGARAAFLEMVRQLSAFDNLPASVRSPKGVPWVGALSDPVAAFRKQGAGAVVSAAAFERVAMWPMSCAVLMVLSNEVMRDMSQATEVGIMRGMAEAIARKVDYMAFDPGNSGVANTIPAALTSGAASFSSTGDLAADVALALTEFNGSSLRNACWIADPKTLAAAGLGNGGSGLARDLGALGGRLAGLPALPCEQLTADSSGVGPLILLDSSAVVYVDEGVLLSRSTATTVEMSDAPAAESLGPTGATGATVSMFQTENTAVMGVRRINWRLGRSTGCVVITDADYSAS